MPFQSPNPDALWKKPEDHRRNFRFEYIAHSYSRWRLHSVDQLENMPCDEIRAWRVFHGVFDDFPCFGDFCIVARLRFSALDDALVKLRGNIARLKIDNPHARMAELELDGHGKGCQSCFCGVVSRHERHWKPGSQGSDVNDQTFSACLHVAKCELHQLDLTKNKNLKLARNRFHRKELRGSKM